MQTVYKDSHRGINLFIQVTGCVVVLLSLLGLSRWIFETPSMQGSLPEAPAAKVNGLIIGFCFGVILLLINRTNAVAQGVFRVLAAFILVISCASVSQDIFGINLGIDELFIKDNNTLSAHPGRLALAAAVGFIIVASAMLMQTSHSRRIKLLSKAMLHIVATFCFFILITYLYGVTQAHRMYATSIMSIPACITLFLISVSASLIEPEMGLTSVFFGNKLGSQIARMLFPLLVLTILAEGFGQVLLSHFNWVSEYFGITLLLFSFMLTCLGIVAFMSFRFNHLDDERTDTMQQILIQNEELRQLAYITSHDLQEPLRTIQSYSSLLQKELPATEKNKQYLEGVTESAGRMSSLIRALLHYNLLGRSSDYNAVSFNTLWHEVLQDIDDTRQQTNATIAATTSLPVIEGSVQELRQLLQNLVSNALKFRNENHHPLIELSVQEQKNEWLFALKDNGIGIPPRYREKVFHMFQRLHGADEYEGFGVGLSYCKKIVELHNGKIWIDSADGGGTVFYFTISKNIKTLSYA